jgi:hypothetical protein
VIFNWFKSLFRSRWKIEVQSLDYDIKMVQGAIARLQDAVDKLNHVSTLKEHKVIHSGGYWAFGDSERRRDLAMQDERDKCRSEGFQFCFRMQNKDEVWVKY